MRFNITDNVIVRALNKICDMVCLNVLWADLLHSDCNDWCVYHSFIHSYAENGANEEGYIFRGFFKAFKSNFKQSTIIWIVILLLGIVCWIDFQVAGMIPGTAGLVMRSIFILVGFILLSVINYIFPLAARYENSIRATSRKCPDPHCGTTALYNSYGCGSCWCGYCIAVEQRYIDVCNSALVSDRGIIDYVD